MTNKTIKTGLSSVLIFLSFKKLYDLLTSLLLWLNVELRIESESILIAMNVLLGLISLTFLVLLSNRLLGDENLKNRTLYYLIGLCTLLTVSLGLINRFYGKYLSNSDLEGFEMTYAFQFLWTETFDMIVPIFGLVYYIWKMKKNTVANKTYT